MTITIGGITFSSLLSVFFATYLQYLLLGYFDIELNFIPVLIWVVLQLLGSARDSFNSRLQSAKKFDTDRLDFENKFGISFQFQSLVFPGQFWGLLIGGLAVTGYLLFIK